MSLTLEASAKTTERAENPKQKRELEKRLDEARKAISDQPQAVRQQLKLYFSSENRGS